MKNDSSLYQNPGRAADRFLSALLPLLKREKFENITITQLCQEANLSRKTFYENFRKKEDLLDYFVNAASLAYTHSEENQREPLLHYFRYWYDMQDWVIVFIENDLWYEITGEAIKHNMPLFNMQNWEELLGKQYKNYNLLFHFLNAAFSEVTRQWALGGFKESPEELTAMTKLILSGTLLQ